MLKSLLSDRQFLFLLLCSLLVKLFSLNEAWVERYYTYGFYPYYSRFLRFILGWIPFSVGDLMYVAAFVLVMVKLTRLIRLLLTKKGRQVITWPHFRKYLKLALFIYLLFNISWGLNYNRLGIASQLGLKVDRYSKADLLNLTRILQQRLNDCAHQVDTVERRSLDRNRFLFEQAAFNYRRIQEQYPFLAYRPSSMKASLLSSVGHYFGFSGYINPFTNEAQINTAEPVYTKPFVIGHEIAHQVGYGKENEASFVSFLVNKNSDNIDFRYSVYYELFFDALFEYRATRDTSSISGLLKNMHPRVKQDWWDEIVFRQKRKNKMQPYVSDFYNNYLKLNNQPKGIATYNEVTAWLIAYWKKYGADAF